MSLAELSEERTFWENFLKNLREDYYMPRIRMEIVIGEMLSAGILEDIVRKELKKYDIHDIKYITKEFPIRYIWGKDKNIDKNKHDYYRIFSVDYLMGYQKNLYFVELKTNENSVNIDQKRRYLNAIKNIKERKLDLYRDYEDIVAHSKDGKYEHKYSKQKEQIVKNGGENYLKNCNNISVIYIVPKNSNSGLINENDIRCIYWEDLFEDENFNTFERNTQTFLKICQEVFSNNKELK